MPTVIREILGIHEALYQVSSQLQFCRAYNVQWEESIQDAAIAQAQDEDQQQKDERHWQEIGEAPEHSQHYTCGGGGRSRMFAPVPYF